MKKALCICLAMMFCSCASVQKSDQSVQSPKVIHRPNFTILNSLSQNDVSAKDSANKRITKIAEDENAKIELEQVNLVNSDEKKALYVKIADKNRMQRGGKAYINIMATLAHGRYVLLHMMISEEATKGDNIEKAMLEITNGYKSFWMIKGNISDYKLYESKKITFEEYDNRLEEIRLN